MDISEDRNKLRENAKKTAARESEPVSPHIFDELPHIPKPNQVNEEKKETSRINETAETILADDAEVVEYQEELENENEFEEDEEEEEELETSQED